VRPERLCAHGFFEHRGDCGRNAGLSLPRSGWYMQLTRLVARRRACQHVDQPSQNGLRASFQNQAKGSMDKRTSLMFIETAVRELACLESSAERKYLFAAGFFEGGDVFESADRQAQVEFGQAGPQIVGQAFRAAVRQRVGIRPPDPDGRRAQRQRDDRIGRRANPGVEHDVRGTGRFDDAGSNCSVETAEFA
jgi:hypothetical protein